MASPSFGLPASFAGEHHFLTSFPHHQLPGVHWNDVPHIIPADLFETRVHEGGVVITGITQDYFNNDGNIIGWNIIIPWMIHWQPVVEIGTSVFRGLSITSVRFPKTIASIQSHAFSECRWLKTVEFLSKNPIFCGHGTFAGTQLSGPIDNLQAIVPHNAVPFPPGCVVEQATFWRTPGIDTVIRDTRWDVADQLPIYRAPSTSPSYYPPTGEPPRFSGTSG